MSTFAEFLITRGEGIHGLCVAALDDRALQRLRAELPESGVSVGQAATVDGAAHHYHLDTRAALDQIPQPAWRRRAAQFGRAALGAHAASRPERRAAIARDMRNPSGLDNP